MQVIMISDCTKLVRKKLCSEIKVTIENRLIPIAYFHSGARDYKVYYMENDKLGQLPTEMREMLKSFMMENTLLVIDDADYYYLFACNLESAINLIKSYIETNDVETK